MPGSLRDPVTGEMFPFWSRGDWGARPPVQRHALASTREGVFYHHTVTDAVPAPAVLRGVQSWHINGKGWLDVAYSFAVGIAGEHDGHVFECRGFNIAGGHTENMNSHSHAVVFIGDTDHDPISPKARRAALAVAREIERRHGGNRVRCHGDVAATACPGTGARAWVHAGRPIDTPAPIDQEPDDMPLSDADLNRIRIAVREESRPRVINHNNAQYIVVAGDDGFRVVHIPGNAVDVLRWANVTGLHSTITDETHPHLTAQLDVLGAAGRDTGVLQAAFAAGLSEILAAIEADPDVPTPVLPATFVADAAAAAVAKLDKIDD